MARARVQVVEGAERTLFAYHLPARWFTPAVWLWCLAGGLPIGIGAALAARAAIDYPLLIQTMLAGVTIVAAGGLYVLYILNMQRLALHIAFDRRRDRVGYRPIHARRWTWYPRSSVEGFRLERATEGPRVGCALIMTTRASALTLVRAPMDCYAQSGLPHLVTRLNMQLERPQRDAAPELPLPEEIAPPLAPDDLDEVDEPRGLVRRLPSPPDARD